MPRPMTSASVVVSSNQSSALAPVRPTVFRSFMPAMPSTSVVNTTGAISILISRTKPSPSGCMAMPQAGRSQPKNTATMIATRTCTYRLGQRVFEPPER